jgi:hypothetical protein
MKLGLRFSKTTVAITMTTDVQMSASDVVLIAVNSSQASMVFHITFRKKATMVLYHDGSIDGDGDDDDERSIDFAVDDPTLKQKPSGHHGLTGLTTIVMMMMMRTIIISVDFILTITLLQSFSVVWLLKSKRVPYVRFEYFRSRRSTTILFRFRETVINVFGC